MFYYRFPDVSRGHIFAITEKIFPTITGVGIHTVEELIRADHRAALMARTYLRRFASRRDEILRPGEILKLVETGNHAQDCIFRDGMHLHTKALERVIDEISHEVTGFFIGDMIFVTTTTNTSSKGAISKSSNSMGPHRKQPAFMTHGIRSSQRIRPCFSNGDWSSQTAR